MDHTANVPATIQAEAKARALKLIEANKDCTSYVRPEDLDTAALFVPVVSVIKPQREDFYDPIPEVGIMAKPPLMNLIREKAGVEILRTETSKRGPHIWVAHAWGQKRMPDGTMLPGDASYEFNSDERCELDFVQDKNSKYTSEIAKRKHILKTARFGEQRAVTGAQHALICKLAKVARSFKSPEELMRGMIVSRVDRNVNGVLADPELRAAALDRMLGASDDVYGPQKQIPRTYDLETQERIDPPAATGTPALPGQMSLLEGFEDDAAELTPVQKAIELLKTYRDTFKNSSKALKLIEDTIAKPDVTLQDVNLVIDSFEAFLQKKKGGAA